VIAGWLVKIVVVIALVGFAALELGSPLWTRAQLDGIAHDAADEGARVLKDTHDHQKACAAAEAQAEQDGATLTACDAPLDVANPEAVRVTLFKQAKSYLLHKFGPTKEWYAVTITAKSVPGN
jgi:hypothetical protein